MTTSSLPYNFKTAFTDTTVMSIGVNGTVATKGDIHVSGKVEVSGGLNVAGAVTIDGNLTLAGTQTITGATNFHARTQVGSSAGDVADVVLCRTVNVSGTATKRSSTPLPHGAHIMDIDLFMQTTGVTAGSTMDIMVGTSTHDTRFGRFANVSAQGHYDIAVSAQTSAWLSVSAADSRVIVVNTTAMSGALAS